MQLESIIIIAPIAVIILGLIVTDVRIVPQNNCYLTVFHDGRATKIFAPTGIASVLTSSGAIS